MSLSEPQPITLLSSQEMDAARVGMIASIVGGSVMLVAAIFYVTTVQVDSDYSYLILGMMLGTVGVCVIGYLEVCKRELLPSPSEVLKDYLGSAAVVFGVLATLWISRFSIWFLAVENSLIAQDTGGNFWIPDWMPMVQTIGTVGTVALGAWMAQRHSLGNSVRAALILAPISVSFSVITIWLDWSAPGLSIWVSLGHVILLSSSILYALHLDRAPLYLLAAGVATVFPLLFSLTSVGTLAIGLLVPIIVLVGMTAMDRSLDRKMIENSSGFVVGAVLLSQFVSSGESFVFAGFVLTSPPFDLSFVLWATLLVGWFGPTYMQRTPAMPIGLALALALLQAEASAVAWSVAFLAFIYLATRDHARTWVITWTFVAMIASWWFSALDVNANHQPMFGFVGIEVIDFVYYILFPGLIGLGIWQVLSSRFPTYIVGILALVGTFTPITSFGEDILFSILVIGTAFFAIALEIRESSERNSINTFRLLPALIALFFTSMSAGPVLAVELGGTSNLVTLLVVPVTGLLLYALTYSVREKEVYISTTNIDKPVFGSHPFRLSLMTVYTLLFFGQFVGLHTTALHADLDPSLVEALRLILFSLTVGIIALEGGILKSGTSGERLSSSIAILILIWGASINLKEDLTLLGALLRELIMIGALIAINLRYQTKSVHTLEERTIDQSVLGILLLSSFMDLSGGLWSVVVFFLVADRSIRHQHGIVQILLLPAAFAISIMAKDGVLSEHGIVWNQFDLLPYLSEFSNLLGNGELLPRWSILFLIAISAISLYRHRDIANPRYEYTKYLPYFWLVVSVAVILPDARYVPGLFTCMVTVLMLRTGYLSWFWFNPLAAGWSAAVTLDLIQDNEWGLDGIQGESAIAMTIGIVSFAQLFAYRYGFLHQFTDQRIESQGFNLEEGPGENFAFNLYNRVLGYSTLILFAPEQVVDYLPFIQVMLTALLGVDLYFSRLLWPLRLWIIPMVYYTGQFIYDFQVGDQPYFYGEVITLYDHFAFTLLIMAGFYQLYCSYMQVNEFNEDSDESHAGIIGTFSAILGLWWFIDMGDYNLGALNGILMVAIFGHHLVLGFGRDDSWRRLLSLIGLPTGMLVTGFSFDNQLVAVISLFLAAMTLIAQGIMYSARGGLGMGSAKSEGGVHMDSLTAFIKPNQVLDEESETEDEEVLDEDESPDEDDDDIESDESDESPSIEENASVEEDSMSAIRNVRFPLLGSSIDMEIEGAMLQRIIASVGAAGTPGFKPLVHINGQGILSLIWEPIIDSHQEE